MTPIFKSNGLYLGFISNGNLFSRDGEYLGWVEDDFVWDAKGRFRGQILAGKYIAFNQFAVPPIPRVPRVAPIAPILPASPSANPAPISLPPGWSDGFK